jgi:hypothetical protein
MKTSRTTIKLLLISMLAIGLTAYITGCKETTASTVSTQEGYSASSCSQSQSCGDKADSNSPCPKGSCTESCKENSCPQESPKCSKSCDGEPNKGCCGACKPKGSCK